MTPEDRRAVLSAVNTRAAMADYTKGPDYPDIYRRVAASLGISIEDVHSIVRDDAAGTMGVG